MQHEKQQLVSLTQLPFQELVNSVQVHKLLTLPVLPVLQVTQSLLRVAQSQLRLAM
jgi:hypothetical protein